MRRLRQPGPAAAERLTLLPGRGLGLTLALPAGLTLNAALTGALRARGHRGGVAVLRGVRLGPLRYVIPALATDARHAAYYSATHAPEGEVVAEQINATLGEREGEPFTHLHAVWTDAGGRRHAGHLLPHDTLLAAPAEASAWVVEGASFTVRADAETNFSLFQPEGNPDASGNAALVKIQPNEDFSTALRAACARLGWAGARLRGGVGSLVGARFRGGPGLDAPATEVLVRDSEVAELRLLAVDHQGRIAEGLPEPGENAVCMTFEGYLERI
ncbi:hypothetical protein NON00_05360 [Roseomonas sp. GC11]|uniref:hypothetical protein n=1 Tax=Roseomonas sp. GC11 TaxID=2950546 RepID=UPI00210A68BE|nr:hypothetical protein [Roseomonas sp. GC11]MCQ4159349.1 hypothetical protein [Roseomonas sp. GC11]